MTEAERKKLKKRQAVEGRGARGRLDRKAAGGSVREQFNSAIHDQPARPTIDEPGPLPAVAARARGGAAGNKGWVDGQPKKGGN